MTECDNCGKKTDKKNIVPLEEVPHLLERIEPGQTVPAGECKSCGALVYPLPRRGGKKTWR